MKGFTLIELMITVAVVGILAAVAYPSYVEHVYRSRRVEAKATLMELAQWMERNYMLCSGYDKDCAGKDIDKETLKTQINGRSVVDHYDFTFVGDKPASNAFTLSATTTGLQADDKCTVLTLTNTGVKCAYIDGGAKVDADGSCSTAKEVVEQCWR